MDQRTPCSPDGARLQALEASHMYYALLKWHTKKVIPILHQERLEEAKDKEEQMTGLRPTNEKLLKERPSPTPPKRPHYMHVDRKDRGPFWNNITGHDERAFCSFCKRKRDLEILENEQHIWLQYEENDQSLAWETAEKIWDKTTERTCPVMSLGPIRGTTALVFEDDYSKDSERLRTDFYDGMGNMEI